MVVVVAVVVDWTQRPPEHPPFESNLIKADVGEWKSLSCVEQGILIDFEDRYLERLFKKIFFCVQSVFFKPSHDPVLKYREHYNYP